MLLLINTGSLWLASRNFNCWRIAVLLLRWLFNLTDFAGVIFDSLLRLTSALVSFLPVRGGFSTDLSNELVLRLKESYFIAQLLDLELVLLIGFINILLQTFNGLLRFRWLSFWGSRRVLLVSEHTLQLWVSTIVLLSHLLCDYGSVLLATVTWLVSGVSLLIRVVIVMSRRRFWRPVTWQGILYLIMMCFTVTWAFLHLVGSWFPGASDVMRLVTLMLHWLHTKVNTFLLGIDLIIFYNRVDNFAHIILVS